MLFWYSGESLHADVKRLNISILFQSTKAIIKGKHASIEHLYGKKLKQQVKIA